MGAPVLSSIAANFLRPRVNMCDLSAFSLWALEGECEGVWLMTVSRGMFVAWLSMAALFMG